MKEVIDYLQQVRKICRDHDGKCKRCPLGIAGQYEDADGYVRYLCPFYTCTPMRWSDSQISEMVKIGGRT